MTPMRIVSWRQPRIRVQQQGITQTYNLNIDFEVTWEKSELLLGQTFSPGVIISDEGQDLGLGLTQLTGLEWSTQGSVRTQVNPFQDTVSPLMAKKMTALYMSIEVTFLDLSSIFFMRILQ